MLLSSNSIGFIVGVFLIALTCWYLRTRIESEPEPFFLNLTFFAFAGQFIRTAEWTSQLIAKERMLPGYGKMLILLLTGFLTVIAQAYVMKVHMQITKAHYTELLKASQLKLGQDHQIDRWATVLLRVTDVDFLPGGYGWLKKYFPAEIEPKERSRSLAVSVMPPKEFRINSDGITAQKLIVPPTKQRKVYWGLYVALFFLSWIWFVFAMIISQEQL